MRYLTTRNSIFNKNRYITNMEFFKNLYSDEKKFFTNYIHISFLLNSILIPLTGIYEFGFNNSYYGQILGILFLFTFFYNLGLIYLNEKHLNKTINKERQIHLFTYGYLLFAIFTITTLMPSSGIFVDVRRPRFEPIYYQLWIFAFVISYFDFKIVLIKKWKITNDPIQIRRKEKGLKIILLSLIVLTSIYTGYFLINLQMTGRDGSVHPTLLIIFYIIPILFIPIIFIFFPIFIILIYKYRWKGTRAIRTLIGLCKVFLLTISLTIFIFCTFLFYIIALYCQITTPYRLFWWHNIFFSVMISLLILLLPIITVLLYKLIPKEQIKIIEALTYLGLILTLSFSLPYLTAPVSMIDANNQFADAFGRNWNKFSPRVEEEFLDMQQVLIQSWFGEPELDPDSWKLDSDNVYNETDEYKLEYDVYYPGPIAAQFIGKKATIIFIHGGGWSGGYKTDHAPYFKYFAAQGYVVFSIEYRLIKLEGSPHDNHVGDYNVEDMMEDVAKFTQFLALNEDEKELVHGADLDNVFLMGMSAGAHLAGLAGFGYNEDEWALHQRLEIKGIIMFYPCDKEVMNIIGKKWTSLYQGGFTKYKTREDDPDFFDLYTPSKLVDKDDPPCIIFQGSSDAQTSLRNAEEIKKACKNEGVDVILVMSYFIGHAHDFSVFFKTMSTYYIERFMYIIKED